MRTDSSEYSPEAQYLAEQLIAVERCAYFALLTRKKICWPLQPEDLEIHRLDAEFFEPLAALNERFAKLQDILGAAMRNATFLLAESVPTFLHVLEFYEKHEVIESVNLWQRMRKLRNDAAHEYDIAPRATAEHFNLLEEDLCALVKMTFRFVAFVRQMLKIEPPDREIHRLFCETVEGIQK